MQLNHLIQTLNKITMKHQIIVTHTVQTVHRRLGGWSLYKLQHTRDWDSPNIYFCDFCASKVLLLSMGKIFVLNINQK